MAQIAAQNLKDVSEALRWAHYEEKALEIYGGGTKRNIGRPIAQSHALGLQALSGVLFYQPEELVISVQAATPLAEVQQLLGEKNQMLGFEPVDWRGLFSTHKDKNNGGGAATCGGIIGSNAAGSRRIIAGAARDHLLGFRAISSNGTIFQSGGRVVKNVTGYDVCKLLSGSWGTLAVMSELTLKTMPAPETTRTLFLYGVDDSTALQWIEQVLSKNFGVSGAVYIPMATTKQWSGLESSQSSLTAFRLEGTNLATQAKLTALQTFIGKPAQMNNNEGKASLNFWATVNNLSVFSAPAANINAPLWRILTPRSKAANLALRLAAECEDSTYFIDWGGGLIWLSHDILSGETELENFIKKAGQIRNICLENEAEAILIRASAEARSQIPFMPPLSATLAALNARIKNAFDPKAILNPGRIYFGI